MLTSAECCVFRLATFLEEMQGKQQLLRLKVWGQILAIGGDLESSVTTALGRTNVYYQMTVSDPAAYASA